MSNKQAVAAYRMAAPYAAFLYIWGLQWILSSGLRFLGQWRDFETLQQAIMWAALAVSVILMFRTLRSNEAHPAVTGARTPLANVVPVLVLFGVLGFYALARREAIDPFLWPLLKGIVLTFAYAWLSRKLGRPLMYLSWWMLALTVTMAWWYLGFAQVILGVFGGLSMMALAWMIGMWNKGMKYE
ncbi:MULTISPECIES: hypothetical protein [unclassified Paenibacillus]|uniref:hypothetical protein n=1 Tax=unclassified Paenibacillus TaxID=185978 RepID=UPI001AE3A90F|nr:MULTISPECIES: hypothetical protein [unclassified Paenibacillus]MBP1157549.1 hypothetical protein [Paenibacillus sp. PvP091]MBP1171714.1 hypothetical protein [Paenibacillus sp. PvR098]MBP2438095.1 hypothetical protein [Paenibacillus sp. PvP052]